MIEFELLACHWTSKSPSVVPAFTIQTAHVSHLSKAMAMRLITSTRVQWSPPWLWPWSYLEGFSCHCKVLISRELQQQAGREVHWEKNKNKKTMPSGFNSSCPPGCALTCARHWNFKWFLIFLILYILISTILFVTIIHQNIISILQ